jgi:energy-coupling factor transport system substrate-specific component
MIVMKSAVLLWSNTRMIVLVAVCAAIYAAALITFKTAIPLVPGITEVRVAGVFPIVLGFLFGPAGAWGLAFGNLIGDIFGGTLTPASISGVVGNFLLGYLPYTLWTTLVPFAEKSYDWNIKRWRSWTIYILVSIVASSACGVVVGIVVDALGMVPYAVLSKIIALNDTIGAFIGVILLIAVYDVTKRHLGLVWTDVMGIKGTNKAVTGIIGAWIVAISAIIGVTAGFIPDLPGNTIGWLSAAGIVFGCLLL